MLELADTQELLSSLIFLIIGLVIGIFFINAGRRAQKAKREWTKVTATISDIERRVVYRKGRPDSDYRVFLDYTYNNESYNHIRSYDYRSGYKVGDELTIYVNPENPTDTSTEGSAIFTIIGIIAIVISFVGAVGPLLVVLFLNTLLRLL